MKRIRHLFLASVAAGAATGAAPAQAQNAPVAAAAPVADPAKLAAARQVVVKLVPEGLYRRMMGEGMNEMMRNMAGSIGDLPMRDLIRAGGLSEAQVAQLGDAKISELMLLLDPHWHERTQLSMRAMTGELAELMASMEPAIRDALSQSYAREFSAAELADMARFFATPSGEHFAAQSMALFMAPEMMKAMSDLTPQIMQRMPQMMEKVQGATKHLPPAREYKDLSEAERRKFAELLGLDPEEAGKPGRSNKQ